MLSLLLLDVIISLSLFLCIDFLNSYVYANLNDDEFTSCFFSELQ